MAKGCVLVTGSTNKEIFAENLKYYMALHGVDRTQLCVDLNFKYSTVSEWISAKKYPRIDSIELLATYFGVLKSSLIEKNDHSANCEEEYLLAARSKDGKQGVCHLTKEEYQSAKAFIQTLRKNSNPDL